MISSDPTSGEQLSIRCYRDTFPEDGLYRRSLEILLHLAALSSSVARNTVERAVLGRG